MNPEETLTRFLLMTSNLVAVSAHRRPSVVDQTDMVGRRRARSVRYSAAVTADIGMYLRYRPVTWLTVRNRSPHCTSGAMSVAVPSVTTLSPPQIADTLPKLRI